jgi:hypothetical protein
METDLLGSILSTQEFLFTNVFTQGWNNPKLLFPLHANTLKELRSLESSRLQSSSSLYYRLWPRRKHVIWLREIRSNQMSEHFPAFPTPSPTPTILRSNLIPCSAPTNQLILQDTRHGQPCPVSGVQGSGT